MIIDVLYVIISIINHIEIYIVVENAGRIEKKHRRRPRIILNISIYTHICLEVCLSLCLCLWRALGQMGCSMRAEIRHFMCSRPEILINTLIKKIKYFTWVSLVEKLHLAFSESISFQTCLTCSAQNELRFSFSVIYISVRLETPNSTSIRRAYLHLSISLYILIY